MPSFTGQSQSIQDTLQEVCCYELCEPVTEPEDNQFLAAVLWGLVQSSSINPSDITNDQANQAARDVSCELNMATLCSFPNDKMKAIILAYIANYL
jgi:hypothetical protein